MFRSCSGLAIGSATVLGLSRSALETSRPVRAYNLDTGGKLPLQLPSHYTVLYTVPPSSRSDADVRLAGLLGELTPAPQRFVYISTTGVYGNRDGGWVSRPVAVATFLAILELTRLEALSLYQTVNERGLPAGPIHLRRSTAGHAGWRDLIAEIM